MKSLRFFEITQIFFISFFSAMLAGYSLTNPFNIVGVKLLSVFFSIGFSFYINNYFDYELDEQKETGSVFFKKSVFLRLCIVLFFLSIILAAIPGLIFFANICFLNLISYLYSSKKYKLKATFFGPLAIHMFCGFLFSYMFNNNLYLSLFFSLILSVGSLTNQALDYKQDLKFRGPSLGFFILSRKLLLEFYVAAFFIILVLFQMALKPLFFWCLPFFSALSYSLFLFKKSNNIIAFRFQYRLIFISLLMIELIKKLIL